MDALQNRINQFMEYAQVPMEVYAATDENHFRKPATGMWDYFAQGLNIDKSKSYYVGDAAGRPKAWNGNPKTKKDHSCGDRKVCTTLTSFIFASLLSMLALAFIHPKNTTMVTRHIQLLIGMVLMSR